MSEFDKAPFPDHQLTVPGTYVRRAPQSVVEEGAEALNQHLLKALDIGLIAMDSATAGLNMADLEDKMEDLLTTFGDRLTASTTDIDALIDEKLVGEHSTLKMDLKAVLGDEGSIAKLFKQMAEDLTNPDSKSSVPSAILESFGSALEAELQKITAVLDPTKDGPFGQGIRTIKEAQSDAGNQLREVLEKMAKEQTDRFKEILHGLELAKKDEALIAQEKEALRKSSHKGVYFENDMLEALQQIRAASRWNDEIIHIGAKVVEGSLVRAGDIHIKIVDAALTAATASIAVEAKAGVSIGLTKISEEAKRGREARSADAGIGVMVREARGATQAMLSSANAGKDTIAVVDWAPGELNDDPAQWVALEAAYATTRASLIAEAAAASGGVDAEAIRKQADQIKKDLQRFSDLKKKVTNAKTSVDTIATAVDDLENKLKESIGTLKDLTQP